MTNSTKNRPELRAVKRAAATAADYGLNGRMNLNSVQARCYENSSFKFEEEVVKLPSGDWRYRHELQAVDHHHLKELVQEAAKNLASKWWPEGKRHNEYGIFPYNFAKPDHSPWASDMFFNSGAPCVFLEKEDGPQVVQGYLRTAGWLRASAAGKYPAVKKALAACQGKGAGSYATLFSIFEIAQRFRTPGNFERRLWATRERAAAILSTFEGGIMPSWKALVLAVMANASTGKAAVMAVASTLKGGRDQKLTYREAREFLVEHASTTAHYGPVVELETIELDQGHQQMTLITEKDFRLTAEILTLHDGNGYYFQRAGSSSLPANPRAMLRLWQSHRQGQAIRLSQLKGVFGWDRKNLSQFLDKPQLKAVA